MRDLVLVEGPYVSSLVRALSESLRAKIYRWDSVRGDDVEGMEALVVHPMAEPFEYYLNSAISVSERISGRARRIVLAVPYMGIKAEGRVLQYLAGGLDLMGADHVIVSDPLPEVVTALRTPLVAVSAYPEIAKWLSGKIVKMHVAAPPRLENRAEAFAELVGAELRVMPSDRLDELEVLDGEVLLWDLVTSCDELGKLMRLRAAYYAVPHIGCREMLTDLPERIVASDSMDNPYSKITLAGALTSAALAL
ncbi:MAG TPA: hypothetical protein ENO38_00830 [Nitrososphaeria archaeon]|nr:hypothetical protein [Conexivisphaerales archaeon]PMP97445.1 MAG: hypothetical protein C0167_01040 [Nitrososphaera sp.]HEU16205.1 hypothetical protein [Nitrososphaeria archaeon]